MTRLSHSHSALVLYDNCPLRYYYQRVAKAVVDKGGEASLYGERVHKFLEDRLREKHQLPQEVEGYDDMAQAIEEISRGGELLVEKELTLTDKFTPTGWFEPDAWFRSKLDVLVLRPECAYVLDWKTGKRKPDFAQLELFAMQVFMHYPEVDTVKTCFVWLKETKMDSETFTRDQLPDITSKLLKRVVRIEKSLESENWPAKPSGLCKFCPARNMCDYALT